MNNLKKYREEKGYKLQDLANLTELSIGYICHLERETRSNPSYKVMKKIALILEKKISEVFPEE